jgi:ElaA protein
MRGHELTIQCVGIAYEICQYAHAYLKEHTKANTVKIHAQVYARPFYTKLGYQVVDESVFDEDGIPHVAMTCAL